MWHNVWRGGKTHVSSCDICSGWGATVDPTLTMRPLFLFFLLSNRREPGAFTASEQTLDVQNTDAQSFQGLAPPRISAAIHVKLPWISLCYDFSSAPTGVISEVQSATFPLPPAGEDIHRLCHAASPRRAEGGPTRSFCLLIVTSDLWGVCSLHRDTTHPSFTFLVLSLVSSVCYSSKLKSKKVTD